jgi:hypothetical protein
VNPVVLKQVPPPAVVEAEIVVAEDGEPNAVIDFLDAKALAGKHGRNLDPLIRFGGQARSHGRSLAAALPKVPSLGAAPFLADCPCLSV